MKIDILTLFPDIFAGPLTESIIKRAQESNLVKINIHNLRSFTKDKHNTADDKPYGGGGGMVLKPEPIFEAVDKIRTKDSKLILMSPRGAKFTQKTALDLSKEKDLLFICGHYEGIDERVRIGLNPFVLSIGDYVLTNGSLATMVVVDAVVRLIPGVLGNPNSTVVESFSDNMLEYPQYTRPSEYRGMKVPKELLSGDHQEIEKWRKEQSFKVTRKYRPDILGGK